MHDTQTAPELGMGARYAAVRRRTEDICARLAVEDHVIQSMPDVSPPKWHLAHTTWFFETFLLQPFVAHYRVADPLYNYLFNSYYDAVGSRHPRPARGLLSRPTLEQVLAYRKHVDAGMHELLESLPAAHAAEITRRFHIGCNHEEQHQELLYMDIKHILWQNPSLPAYANGAPPARVDATTLRWVECAGGLADIGHSGEGFCFDNEIPRHRVLLEPYALASRCVTNAEYLEFIEAGGYREAKYWLADGWARAQTENWRAPLYWLQRDGRWYEFTLHGLDVLDPATPVVHVGFFEAEAFARWSGVRLPTEFEWENAARAVEPRGNFAGAGVPHPRAAPRGSGLQQLFGDVWELTRSDYAPYPRYVAEAGALGEYNGKWMSGQMVLRGGACVTPEDHVRVTYRNFFPPHTRWAFQGLRLARDAGT